jgi:hypothetical protein
LRGRPQIQCISFERTFATASPRPLPRSNLGHDVPRLAGCPQLNVRFRRRRPIICAPKRISKVQRAIATRFFVGAYGVRPADLFDSSDVFPAANTLRYRFPSSPFSPFNPNAFKHF